MEDKTFPNGVADKALSDQIIGGGRKSWVLRWNDTGVWLVGPYDVVIDAVNDYDGPDQDLRWQLVFLDLDIQDESARIPVYAPGSDPQ